MNKTFASALLAVAASAASGTFDYKQNGADWGQIHDANDDYPNQLCDTGKEQSPIDLNWDVRETDKVMIDLKNYWDYQINSGARLLQSEEVPVEDLTTTSISIAEHTILVGLNHGGFTKTFEDGNMSEFVAAQFHFHAPSEHTLEGKNLDMEMHIVHTYDDGSLGGVIGIFFDRELGGDGENLFVNQILEVFQDPDTDHKVSLGGFLDSIYQKEFWSYDGSLTTPPCTEGIKWNVLWEVQPISESQYAQITALWADNQDYAEGNGNNRVVQPLNDRELLYAMEEVEEDTLIATAAKWVLSWFASSN